MKSAIEYELVRSKRKTLAIQVTLQAQVVVRAPLRLPKREIDAFVLQKEEWIAGSLAEVRRRMKAREEQRFEGRLLLLGREFPVESGAWVTFDGARFTVTHSGFDAAKPALETLYRKLAAEIIGERVRCYSARMGVTPLHVKINGAKGRWGSCSGQNGLNFSWRLILAPLESVDYVVVHELAHIRQHNHSSRFWQAVGEVLPDYQNRRQQLKAMQQRLMLQSGWVES